MASKPRPQRPQPPPAPPDWNAIASYFAGRPVNVSFPGEKPGTQGGPWTGIGGTARGQDVFLSPEARQRLDEWLPSAKSQRGSVLGAQPLALLIHEALHLRNPSSNFKPWDDEPQAHVIASMLVPHLMQKFFGVKQGSPLNRHYVKGARSLSNYRANLPQYQPMPVQDILKSLFP